MPASIHEDQRPGAAVATSGEAHLDAVSGWLDRELGGQPMPPLIIAIGLGDGELLDVLDRRAPATKVLALEPDPAAARRFLQLRDWRAWRETGRLAYLIDPDYAGADDCWRIFPSSPDAHKLIVWPGVSREGSGAVRAVRVAKQIIFGAQANADARRRFAPRYLSATLHNLPEIVGGHDVRGLANAFAGVPAIIAAAGPSLNGTLDDLRSVQDRGLLIAADTALRPLLLHGIQPELVVAVDPGAANARHFQSLPACPATWLVSEASIDPRVIAPFGDRAFWFRVSNHEPWPWFDQIGVGVGQVDVWGSVLTAAFQVAMLAGCDPIVVVGADLSFTHGQPYARGTTYEFDWAHVAAEGTPLDQAWRPFLKPDGQTSATDVRGGEAVSTGILQAFRDWTVARAKKSGRRVINATGAGILCGDGIEQRTLVEALPNRVAVPALSALARVAPSAAHPSSLRRHLDDVRRALDVTGAAPAPIEQWKQFAGEGFDGTSVAAAVGRASRVLGGQAAKPAVVADLIPWRDLHASAAAVETLHRLPEAIGRLRAAYEGRALEPRAEGGVAPQHARLAAAFEILHAIWADAPGLDAGDPATPVPAVILGRAPLGALRIWSQQMGWAIRLFEGLLGDATGHPVTATSSAADFFTGPIAPRLVTSTAARKAIRRKQPHLDHAAVMLALEWLLETRTAAADPRDVADAQTWWRALADLVGAPFDTRADDTGVSLALVREDGTRIDIPVTVEASRLVRLLTGAVGDPAEPIVLGSVVAGGRHASLQIAMSVAPARKTRTSPAPRVLLSPRVLTASGAAKSVAAYASTSGAVVAELHGRRSVIVDETGSMTTHFAWPRPINGELPCGDGGAVAWSVGQATFPEGGRGYAMVRDTRDAEPVIHELPFAPSAGIWHEGRLYWACYPFGVGSWAPGGEPAYALPRLSIYGIEATDDGLVLHERVRDAGGVTERRPARHAWAWTPGSDPRALDVRSAGPESSRSVSAEWTAVACPESDVVRLMSAGGRTVALTCYYPFAVAWAGRSLVVCTSAGDVLLFERLLDVLDGRRTR